MPNMIIELAIAQLKPTIEHALDPICVVDDGNRICYANLQMKAFLNLKAKDVKGGTVFCDLIHLGACEKGCQVLEAIKGGTRLQLDEVPAVRGKEKLRVWLRGTPLFPTSGKSSGAGANGMLIVVRDTTAELVLQAKYHKLMRIMSEREEQIKQLEQRVVGLQGAMRKARDR